MKQQIQRITPHLWFDTQAKAAADFYCSFMPDSSVNHLTVLHDTPSGDCDVVSFTLSGQPFKAISAGPFFTINPSISFFLNFDPSRDADAGNNLDRFWKTLSDGGTPLMPLGEYPFSKRYGWIQDKYGVSWQLILTNPDGDERPFIVPSLMFTGDVCGKAEEAAAFYRSIFSNATEGIAARYPKGMEPNKEGTMMYTDFMINGQWFAAMDNGLPSTFGFNEAVSLLVPCDTQQEIDYFWEKLSAVPHAEQCGWLKDRFGVSWQVVPAELGTMMETGSQEQIDRLTKTFLPMKKFDIARLREAYQQQ